MEKPSGVPDSPTLTHCRRHEPSHHHGRAPQCRWTPNGNQIRQTQDNSPLPSQHRPLSDLARFQQRIEPPSSSADDSCSYPRETGPKSAMVGPVPTNDPNFDLGPNFLLWRHEPWQRADWSMTNPRMENSD
ncbi:hypothetical protein L484_023269 [Morus notabilis]|uniref:Uncharacterized protein n=1 Tax=Morus notabilis TaxID=981085 RepID=W9RN58_9ROSA|nr:hypothetical protein L484_023269 [Morus notabilis]